MEAELGRPLEHYFSRFPPQPIAAASVGQVHDARLRNGQRVAVKVQRPNLKPVFLADIRNLRRLAALVDAVGLSGYLSLRSMVGEFARWTLRELDFTIEGHTADRLRATAGPAVRIPQVYWELTSTRMLTMEFIIGISAAEVGDLLAEGGEALVRTRLVGFDTETALHHFAEASLAQLFTYGFFHADAHPGNLFFCDNNVVAFLDFGIFGTLTPAERAVVTGQALSLALGNLVASFRYYTGQLIATDETDMEVVRKECLVVLRDWYRSSLDPTLPIEERHLARYIGAMIDVSRRNGLRFCLNYLLFWRTMNSLNATAWRVAPRFDLLKELRAFFAQTQKGPAQQTLAKLTDRLKKDSAVALVPGLPGNARTGLATLAAEDAPWQVAASMGPAQRRRAAGQVRWIAAGVLVVALAALAGAGRVAGPLPLVAAGLVLPFLVYSLCRSTHAGRGGSYR